MPKIVKVNSNPNKNPAPGKRNPTDKSLSDAEYWDNVVAPHFGYEEINEPKKTIKVNSNPVPGKTRIGNLSGKARGGAIGGGGWMDQLR